MLNKLGCTTQPESTEGYCCCTRYSNHPVVWQVLSQYLNNFQSMLTTVIKMFISSNSSVKLMPFQWCCRHLF